MALMRAVVFDPEKPGEISDPALPNLAFLRLTETPIPDLPADDWLVIKSRITGICGSDLGFLQGKEMPSIEPYVSTPFIPGHELFGSVEAMGPAVTGFERGDRVVVDPALACAERGFSILCHACGAGATGCERYDEGHLTPGSVIGFCATTGGGFGEYYVARAERAHRVPDALSDNVASLTEPLAVSLRGVLEWCPAPDDDVVVFGAGSIGLFTIAALRAAQPKCRIHAVAKYGFQGEMAGALGADSVIDLAQEDAVEAVARRVGTRVHKLSNGGRLLAGGVPWVFDTVTNERSLSQGLAVLRGSGTMVLLGLPSVPSGIDWSTMIFKETRVVGSFLYGREHFEGTRQPTFARALEWLASGRANVSTVVPKAFAIEDYGDALKLASDKARSETVKISFAF